VVDPREAGSEGLSDTKRELDQSYPFNEKQSASRRAEGTGS
jgi:hypothetical protein